MVLITEFLRRDYKPWVFICLLGKYQTSQAKNGRIGPKHDIVSWICNNSKPKENANSAVRSLAIHLNFELGKNRHGNMFWIKCGINL